MNFGEIPINPSAKSEKPETKRNAPVESSRYGKPAQAPSGSEENIDLGRRKFLKYGSAFLASSIVAGELEEKFSIVDKARKAMNAVFKRKKEEIPEEIVSSEHAYGIAEQNEDEELVIEEEPKVQEIVREKTEYKNIADHYLYTFNDLSKNPEFFPKDLFSDDLFVAQQIQESNGDPEAKSGKGALGVMQNMDISIQDVSMFLEKLHNEKVIKYEGPIYVGDFEKNIENIKKEIAKLNLEDQKRKKKLKKKYKDINKEKREDLAQQLNEARHILHFKRERYGKRVLSQTDLIRLENLRTDNPDYSRALGKLYLMRLYNDKYGYGIGQKAYKNHPPKIKDAQTELLGSYNGGTQLKGRPIHQWPDESKTYVARIFNLMDRVGEVRASMEIAGLDPNDDNAAMMITREMSKVRTQGEKRPVIMNKTLQYVIGLIKERQDAKGGKLEYAELCEIFSSLKNTKDITEKSFYAGRIANT